MGVPVPAVPARVFGIPVSDSAHVSTSASNPIWSAGGGTFPFVSLRCGELGGGSVSLVRRWSSGGEAVTQIQLRD